MPHTTLRFYAELNDFLPHQQRGCGFDHAFEGRVSVKDMIESIGVPHTEIDLILAHDVPVTFDYIVQDGDRLAVYPRWVTLDVSPHRLQPPLPDPPCFVLDVHLGRLAAYLRMFGFDTLYPDNHDDGYLAQIAAAEHRILLTRDQGLLKRKIVTLGRWVRATQPRQQLAEIVRHYDLASQITIFRRCTRCNGILEPVEKDTVRERLNPDTLNYYDEFRRCTVCDRIYWRGSHFLRMEHLIAQIVGQPETDPLHLPGTQPR